MAKGSKRDDDTAKPAPQADKPGHTTNPNMPADPGNPENPRRPGNPDYPDQPRKGPPYRTPEKNPYQASAPRF